MQGNYSLEGLSVKKKGKELKELIQNQENFNQEEFKKAWDESIKETNECYTNCSKGCHSNALGNKTVSFYEAKCLICGEKNDVEVQKNDVFISFLHSKKNSFIQDYDSEWFLDYVYNEQGKVTNKKVNIDRVADHIIKNFLIKTITGQKEESIYTYLKGIWTPQGQGLIKKNIQEILGTWNKIQTMKEIIEKVKCKTIEERKDFDIEQENVICLENGVLDISDPNNIQLKSHNPEYNFTTKLPIKYNPEADCPNIKDFIEQSILPDDHPQVQEWFGLHLERYYKFKKALVVKGPKNSGKTVFLNILTEFMGEDNISGLSLQRISQGKPFDLLTLKDKWANICDDLSAKELKEGGGFKMCVGDSYIFGEQKFGDHIRFRNTAKLTFACNKIPNIDDLQDDAYFDRLLVWRFDNYIPKEQQDEDLISKLTTEEEMSGLLNYALEGLKRLKKNKHFTNERDPDTVKAMIQEDSNPLWKFCREYVEVEYENTVTKEDFYRAFLEFCDENKLNPPSKRQVTNLLPNCIYEVKSSKNNQVRIWKNIKLNYNLRDKRDAHKNIMREVCEEENKDKNYHICVTQKRPERPVTGRTGQELIDSKEGINSTDYILQYCRQNDSSEGILKENVYKIIETQVEPEQVDDFYHKLKEEGKIFEIKRNGQTKCKVN